MFSRAVRLSFLALAVMTAHAFAATVGGTMPVPLPLFPANNWWNTDVSSAPVDTNSASYISFINAPTAPSARTLHPDFGGDAGGGFIYGFPYILVDGTQPKKSVNFLYSDESDGVNHTTNTPYPFYPIPDEAITMGRWIEDGPPGTVDERSTNDRHMLIVDTTNNALYELYNVFYDGATWQAGSGAFFDMNTNNRRPDGWTSADAGGLAMLPGLIRYDEVYGSSEIGHAFRVTVRATNGYVYPASHIAGSTSGALPMGARLRLKASKDISTFPADVQKIFRAFKKYGLIVADNGSDMYVSGTYDTRWNNDVLNPAFELLSASDFEVVQLGWQPSVSFALSIPTVTGAGDAATAALTAYDTSNAVATGYRGTVHFTSSDGAATLPVDYTFTATDAGSHSFAGLTMRTPGGQTVTATDTSNATITNTRNTVVGPSTPTSLDARASSGTAVALSWNPSSGAAQYEVQRASAGGVYVTIGSTAATAFPDALVTSGNAYAYRVRALDSSSRPSPFSIPDAATTIFFTDDALVAGSTIVKAAHINELRTAINALRSAAGLAAFTFTDSVANGGLIRAPHVQELRTALNQARTALGLPTAVFSDDPIATGTIVKAAHLQQLRAGVQ